MWNEEFETFYQRIMKFHDLALGQALLEYQRAWIKPLLKYPILAMDFDYNTDEFHALFTGIVLRDVRRVHQRQERPSFYIACFIYPIDPKKIQSILQDHYCVGVWMMAQKEEWIPKSWLSQMMKKAM